MGKEKELQEGLERLSSRPKVFFTAKVVDVDDNKMTITIDDDIKVYDVRLKSIVDNKQVSIVVIPEVNSSVLVGRISKSDYFVSKVNEIKEIRILFDGGLSVILDKNGIVINEGSFGGLIKIEELVNKLNALEDKLKTHQHLYIPYPSGSPGSPVLTTKDPANVVVKTKVKDLENDKIQH